MKPVVRFAPSPTGNIHLGNLRPALMNWLYAKKHDGRFILRFDDTDLTRSKDEFKDNIKQDLTWLGLEWDQIEFQSKRLDRYEEIANKLKAEGRLYPCYETPEQLEFKRKTQMARGKPPVYDRSALKLTDEEKAQFEEDGISPHWRFKLDQKIVNWQDLIRGDQNIDTASISDPVLIRADGVCLYTLASVIDDIDMGITHILRGEDHVTNTGVQLEIFDALGATRPTFGHNNLLVGKDGEALSKRLGSLSVRELRNQGLESLSVLSLSATIGSSNPIKAYHKVDDVFADFDLSKLSRAAARFDPDELLNLNSKLLHETEFEKVEERLKEMDIQGAFAQKLWAATRANIVKLEDIKLWSDVACGRAKPVVDEEDRDMIAEALKLLPTGEYDEQTWGSWTKAIKEATDRKGKKLFMPLRKVLTGLEHGAELKLLLPVMGEQTARDYLEAALK